MTFLKILAAALVLATPARAAQGVSDDEIVIGSVNDLSGIFAAVGAPAVTAARMHFDAVNANGGIHGRTVRFVVEDSSYQMQKALQGYNKLVNRDRVFAMFLSLGTPMNIAGFKLTTPKNIPNVSPLSAARQMLDEPIRLRFLGSSTYYDQLRLATRYMAEHRNVATVCTMYIPSDFGIEVQEAVRDEAAADAAVTYVTETAHKPDETDFAGSLQKLHAEGCEMIALALGIRQLIAVLGTAKKLGFNDIKFVGSSGSFHALLAEVPGGLTEGLFAAAGWADLAARADQPEPAAFIAAYREAHGEFPGTGALLGYSSATGLTRALEKAGRDLSVDSFLAAMESLDYYDPIVDNHVSYSADDHQGSDEVILSVIEGGKWKEIARLK
ncbi:MAG: ABC transporter substrate-binding protein [Chloroflexi bacterium]|nr:ABC transporter substrate-binding protein [Chloroflexota bacterium]